MVDSMYDGAIITKAGPGGNIANLQGEVYAAVGVRLVKNDTTSGRIDGVDSDSSSTAPQSPCAADNAGAASLWGGNIRCEDGNARRHIPETSNATQFPKRKDTAARDQSPPGVISIISGCWGRR